MQIFNKQSHPDLICIWIGPERTIERSLSVSLIDNLKALIARRRWKRAGTAISRKIFILCKNHSFLVLGRISSTSLAPPKLPANLKSTSDPPLEDPEFSEDEKENHLENIKEVKIEEHDEPPCHNQNSNNNNNNNDDSKIQPEKESKHSLIENLALDIMTTMKFQV